MFIFALYIWLSCHNDKFVGKNKNIYMDNNIIDNFFSCEGSTLEIDPYTGLRRIKWEANPNLIHMHYDLWLGIDFYEDKILICFDTKKKLQVGDCISLLFDNGELLDFPITKKPVKDSHRIYKTTFVLYLEDIETLLPSTIVSYRITYKEELKRPETVDNMHELERFWGSLNYTYRDFYIDEAVHVYVKNRLHTILQLVPDYKIPSRKIEKSTIDYKFPGCYVYLMKDLSNDYYKIGISNKPEYREKTLQSEKPTIELLACKKFPTRKIAEAIESALHAAYSQQRLRGEWFNLNEEDVAAIIETLK